MSLPAAHAHNPSLMRPHIDRPALGLLLSLITLPAAAQTPDSVSTKSILDGVYTAEQAASGQSIMGEVCSACHVESFFTDTFLQYWTGASLYAVYDLISGTMPEDNPGGLAPNQYAAVLAYILSLNGFQPGTEALSPDRAALTRIIIQHP